MSVRITSDEDKVAMFDSTTGIAFGPVFDDSAEVDSFLKWLADKHETNATFEWNSDRLHFMEDPRVYRPNELAHVVELFRDR